MAASPTDKERRETRRFLAKRLANVKDAFLDCRDPSIGHDWKKTEDFHVVPASHEGTRRMTHIARKFECASCTGVKTERYIVVRRDGIEVLERDGVPNIDYPDGYLIPGVPRGVKPAEIIRAEQYRRAVEKAVGAAKGSRLHAAR